MDRKLVLALLSGLAEVGDATTLPYVRELADGQGLAARDPEVRECARATLVTLDQKMEVARMKAKLLRAASPERAAEFELVRLSGYVAGSRETLLRAVSLDDEHVSA